MFSDPLRDIHNLAHLRDAARRLLPRGVFEFVDRGTEDEVALRNNREAIERIRFKPRVLIDVSKRTQRVNLFGKECAQPLAVAPTGAAVLLCYNGEVEIGRAAARADIPFTHVLDQRHGAGDGASRRPALVPAVHVARS